MPTDLALFRIRDFASIAPEVVLSAWSLVVLAFDLVFARHPRETLERRQTRNSQISLIGIALAFVFALLPIIVRLDLYGLGSVSNLAGVDPLVDTDATFFLGTISGDPLTELANLAYLTLLGLVVWMSAWLRPSENSGEFFALLLWSAVGMMVLTAAENLAIVFLGLELMSICLYLLTAFDGRRSRSSEAALKYFVYGSVASALLLFGMSLLYGLTNSLQFSGIHRAIFEAKEPLGLSGNVIGAAIVLLVMAGFGFKLALFPFHQWSPDAYEGAPPTVTSWIATGSKIAGVLVLSKLLIHALGLWQNAMGDLATPGWVMVAAVLGAGSMTYGNFAALAQQRLKRMLAYSSIAHAGYIMIGLIAAGVSRRQGDALAALIYYLGVYAFTNLGAFAIVVWLASQGRDDRIENLNGLASRFPWIGVSILGLMFSLIGLPPFGGFLGKVWMFMEALDPATAATRFEGGRITLIGLVALGLLNTVVSAIYYVRVLKAIYFNPEPTETKPLQPPSSAILSTIVLGAVIALLTGIASTPFLQVAKTAGIALISNGGGIHRAGSSTTATPIPLAANAKTGQR